MPNPAKEFYICVTHPGEGKSLPRGNFSKKQIKTREDIQHRASGWGSYTSFFQANLRFRGLKRLTFSGLAGAAPQGRRGQEY
jgi:hypothetical protein